MTIFWFRQTICSFNQTRPIIIFQFFPNVDKKIIFLAAHQRYLVNMWKVYHIPCHSLYWWISYSRRGIGKFKTWTKHMHCSKMYIFQYQSPILYIMRIYWTFPGWLTTNQIEQKDGRLYYSYCKCILSTRSLTLYAIRTQIIKNGRRKWRNGSLELVYLSLTWKVFFR